MDFNNNSNQLYNFNNHYVNVRNKYTKPIIISNQAIFDIELNEDVDDKYNDLLLVNNKYYTEIEFYRKTYIDLINMINNTKLILEEEKRKQLQEMKDSELIDNLKEIFGSLYVDLINISQEFDIKLNKILEFINLPNENEYLKNLIN